MVNGLPAGIPILILIVGVLITKRMTEPLILSSITAVLMCDGLHALSGYGEKMYLVLSGSSFQLLLIVALSFSGMIALLEKSGAMLGFGKTMEKVSNSPRKTLVLTWLLGGIIFIDDYLNALAVSASMRPIADRQRIPREHLAYTINCMGACVCVMVPISSWSAFAIGCLAEQGLDANTYFKAILYMFYPICAILICLLTATGLFPRLGELRQAYRRVKDSGKVSADSWKIGNSINTNETTASSPLNFLLPMAALIIGMLVFDNNIVIGILLAIATMFLLYIPQKRLKIREFFDIFLDGAATMTPMLINIFIAFVMEEAVEEMGFTSAVIELATASIPPWLLPAVAFLSVGLITFFAASFWALIVISFPIFLPMAVQMGVNPALVTAAVMSGVALGSQACLYSDAIFMVAAGTEVPNEVQFKTVLPYVAAGAAVAAILFIIAGFLF